ncbi:MAG: YIP1 family protein [Candidatus Heimdallarchaeota archaeon]|nr:YIP1 family protein [Candidatus Heimdallarchaeota archaeon]
MSTEDTIIRCPICNETSPQGYLLCPFCGADLTVVYEQKIFAPVTYKESFFRIKELIIKPRKISQIIADNPDSKGGFLFCVVIALGLATQLIAYIIHTRTLDWKFYPVIFLIGWVVIFLLPFLLWFLGSWIIRTMSRLLGGKSSRKQIRSAVGYGMLPVVFAEIFNGIFLLIALPYEEPGDYDITGIIESMSNLRNSFAGITSIIIHFAGIIASGIYIVFIAKPACDFSWVETAIATGVPLLLFTILMISYYIGTTYAT